MTYDHINYLCQNNSLLWDVPIRLYHHEQLDKIYDPFPMDTSFVDFHRKALMVEEKNLNILLTEHFLLFAYINVQNTPYHIFIGPVNTTKISEDDIRRMMRFYKLDPSQVEKYYSYFRSIRIMTIDKFGLLCKTWNLIFNAEISSNPFLDYSSIGDQLTKEIYNENSAYLDKDDTVLFTSKYDLDFEERLLYIVQHGLSEELEKMNQGKYEYRGRDSFISTNVIRQYKDRCISFTTLVSRSAFKGGLNYEIGYHLFDLYCQKIENANTIKELMNIQNVMLNDFTRRVKTINSEEITDPLILKTVSFINRHLNKKLTVSLIASKVGTNANHLSLRFKNFMGKSIPKYINNQKINESKMMLLFTDKSLADIAYYLDYSSQNYFQNVFKKIVGLTPLEYRNLHETEYKIKINHSSED